jgi:CO/xanthine dehydrogenase Mo-binding subunit
MATTETHDKQAGNERAGFLRSDGKEKVTGSGRYTADLNLTGQLYAKFRYADHTHARIVSIDTSKARSLPGVHAVLTHADVPDLRYGQLVKDRLMFARDRVRFEGDIVAAVAAQTPELAARAAAAIEIEYEPLPAISDLESALTADAPLIHEEWEKYEADEQLSRSGNVLGYSTVTRGDADAAMGSADIVVKGRYVTDSSQGAPIEPRAILAQWQGDRVTVWSSTQVPFAARSGVAEVLEIPESSVRVVVPLLGGGFGSKCDFQFEGHVARPGPPARPAR